MRSRLHTLMTYGLPHIAVTIAVGLGIAGLTTLAAFGAGKRGHHLVLAIVIALAAAGSVAVLVGVLADPMRDPFAPALGSSPASLETYDSGSEAAIFRRDDVLYAAGVILIGLAVLAGYVGAWSGVPPAVP